MGAYCTTDDVYIWLAARAFVVRARPFDAIDAATGTIRLKAHGLSADDIVTFEVTSGGTLPTSVSAFTTYFPIPVSSDLFKVSASLGGAALTFAAGGAGWAVAVDSKRRIEVLAELVSAEIDQHLTAHGPPIQVDPSTGKYPPVLVGLAARMTARAAVNSLQVENPAFKVATDRLFAQEEFDKAMLENFRKSWPLHPQPTDATPGVADSGARVASAVPVTDWQGRIP